MSKQPKIKGILTRIYSRRDSNGNVYTAFRYIDTISGHGVVATCDDNIDHTPRYLYPDNPMQVLRQEQEMGQRDFFKMTKNWNYAGSRPEDLALYIKTVISLENKI